MSGEGLRDRGSELMERVGISGARRSSAALRARVLPSGLVGMSVAMAAASLCKRAAAYTPAAAFVVPSFPSAVGRGFSLRPAAVLRPGAFPAVSPMRVAALRRVAPHSLNMCGAGMYVYMWA